MPYNMSDLHNSTYGSLISVDGATFAVSIVLDNVMITDMTWVDITSDKDVKVPSLLLAGRFPVLDPASADDGKYALVVYSPRSSLKLMAHTYGLVSRLVSATSADSAALGLHASVGSDMLPWMLPLVASALLVFLGCFAWVLLMRGSVDKIKAKRGTCGNLGSRDTGAGIDGLDTSTDVTTDEAFDFDIESLETVKKSYSQTTTESDLNLSTAKENCKPISTRPRLAIKTGFAALDKGGCLSPTQQRLLTSESLTSLSDAERPPWLSRASSDASRVLDLEMGCEVTSMSTQNSVYSHIKS